METELKEPQVRIPVPNPHIWLDKRGVAWVGDTNVKVTEIILDELAGDMDADAIHREFPHIPLADIHAAFSYYYDHQQELDAQMMRSYVEYLRLWDQNRDSPLSRKLRAIKERRQMEGRSESCH